jgi:predicted nuclease of predicted toxin-antitoxin system
MSVKLLLDQNMRSDTLEFLRSLGLDATSTRELGMHTATDAEIARWAAENDRIVMTFDSDFGGIRTFPIGSAPGVIRLRIEPQTTEVVHPVLEALFRTIEHESLRRALTTVTRSKIRIRRGG